MGAVPDFVGEWIAGHTTVSSGSKNTIHSSKLTDTPLRDNPQQPSVDPPETPNPAKPTLLADVPGNRPDSFLAARGAGAHSGSHSGGSRGRFGGDRMLVWS